MKVEIKVPPAGESVTEAVVVSLLKPSGSFVEKEEEILELETDKVNQVIHAPEKGVVTWAISLEETVKVGQVIGTIDPQGVQEKKEETPSPQPSQELSSQKPSEEKNASQTETPKGVRHFAQDYVNTLTSPPSIQHQDKEKLTEEPNKVPSLKESGSQQPTQTRKRLSGLRKTIAKRLVQVKNETAMLTTFNEVDMTAIMEMRAQEKESFIKRHGVKLGFMSFFTKACVMGLKTYPEVNAFIEGDELVFNHTYHIGISVSTDKGLLVPVIRDCDRLSFADIEQAIQTFAEKGRKGVIGVEDLSGGSFTITNGGTFGSMLSTPILNPPQSAILGMHNIVKRPVVIKDAVQIRPIMYLALSYDHRVIDGKEAVSFLSYVKGCLEQPQRLMLEI